MRQLALSDITAVRSDTDRWLRYNHLQNLKQFDPALAQGTKVMPKNLSVYAVIIIVWGGSL